MLLLLSNVFDFTRAYWAAESCAVCGPAGGFAAVVPVDHKRFALIGGKFIVSGDKSHT